MRRVLLSLGALALLAPAAPAAPLRADAAVARECAARLLPAGTAGVARAVHLPGRSGVVTVRLRAAGGDWDLALFDGRSRAGIDAAASFGATERVDVPAARGRPLVAQACRRTGRARRARIAFAETAVRVPAGPAERVQMVRVALTGPGELARLEATGLDVTHSHSDSWADVATYSAAERLRLVREGFPYRVRIADMVAADSREAFRARARQGAGAVPSGRTDYRQLADYGTDLKALAGANPTLVRPLEIGRSLEDRPIEGIEIATDVARADDGRPTYAVMGVHHAREWPAGEMPMEFATDLVKRYPSDARVKALLDAVRVVILPIINPDGFAISRGAGATPGDDESFATLPQALTDSASYKRKNCRAPDPGSQSAPCMSRPAAFGVDPNRNYGAYYGGVGSSDQPTAQNHRGTGPFSEPEAEAVHKLSSTRNIVMIITHHTFTNSGVWLRQPGFCLVKPEGRCSEQADIVPDEAGMKLLGDSMGAATGWASQLGWAIGEITGATEDWNYFATGAYGYTPEQRGNNFHPNYATAVEGEYPGVGEALLRAGEFARDRAWHSVLQGAAPAGAVLRLRKSFETATMLDGVVVNDTIDLTTTVPASGRYTWDVNPSTRPLSPAPEAYSMTCERPAGTVLETVPVTVARGQALTVDLACGGPKPRGTGSGATSGTPGPGSRVRVRLERARYLARSLRARRIRLPLRVTGGRVLGARATLADARGRTAASGRASRLSGRVRIALTRRRALAAGRYRLRVTGRDAAGRAVRATLALRVR